MSIKNLNIRVFAVAAATTLAFPAYHAAFAQSDDALEAQNEVAPSQSAEDSGSDADTGSEQQAITFSEAEIEAFKADPKTLLTQFPDAEDLASAIQAIAEVDVSALSVIILDPAGGPSLFGLLGVADTAQALAIVDGLGQLALAAAESNPELTRSITTDLAQVAAETNDPAVTSEIVNSLGEAIQSVAETSPQLADSITLGLTAIAASDPNNTQGISSEVGRILAETAEAVSESNPEVAQQIQQAVETAQIIGLTESFNTTVSDQATTAVNEGDAGDGGTGDTNTTDGGDGETGATTAGNDPVPDAGGDDAVAAVGEGTEGIGGDIGGEGAAGSADGGGSTSDPDSGTTTVGNTGTTGGGNATGGTVGGGSADGPVSPTT